jgi:hypothetical protein
MPIYRIKSQIILFIHVPKCAGTSIESMLLAQPDCEGQGMYEMGKGNLMLAAGLCSPQHYHAEMLRHVLNFANIDFCFAICRHPLQRLLSEHSMQMAKYPGTSSDFCGWYSEMRERRSQDPFCFDNHLRPMKEFLLPRTYLYGLELGLEVIWSDVCHQIGIDSALSKMVHARPCDGPLQNSLPLPIDTLFQITRDYADDFAIHAALDGEWRPGFQCQQLPIVFSLA